MLHYLWNLLKMCDIRSKQFHYPSKVYFKKNPREEWGILYLLKKDTKFSVNFCASIIFYNVSYQ